MVKHKSLYLVPTKSIIDRGTLQNSCPALWGLNITDWFDLMVPSSVYASMTEEGKTALESLAPTNKYFSQELSFYSQPDEQNDLMTLTARSRKA